MNLIEICTRETHFKDFEGNIWIQIHGMAMGKYISGDVTEFFMESYEAEFIQKKKLIRAFWKREVDDVHCL